MCPHCGCDVPVRGDWSVQSQGHFFARLKELYDNLPEDKAKHFRGIEHFRAWCLIHEGYCHEERVVEATHGQALETAAKFIRTLKKVAPYAMVQVDGSDVLIWIAKSQSRAGGMTRDEWQAAKQSVLELAEYLVGGGELA